MATFSYQSKTMSCPVQLSMAVIMGKWKVLLLWQLKNDGLRYGELKRLVPGISHKVLAETLKYLELNHFIERID